jgi:hypothetical protein
MPQAVTRKTLIAKWKPDQDCSVEPPYTVYWSDGSPATSEDYLGHILDTHTFTNSFDGVELRMSPNIVADVRYELLTRQWVISGDGVQTAELDVSDRDAQDDSILAEFEGCSFCSPQTMGNQRSMQAVDRHHKKRHCDRPYPFTDGQPAV